MERIEVHSPPVWAEASAFAKATARRVRLRQSYGGQAVHSPPSWPARKARLRRRRRRRGRRARAAVARYGSVTGCYGSMLRVKQQKSPMFTVVVTVLRVKWGVRVWVASKSPKSKV